MTFQWKNRIHIVTALRTRAVGGRARVLVPLLLVVLVGTLVKAQPPPLRAALSNIEGSPGLLKTGGAEPDALGPFARPLLRIGGRDLGPILASKVYPDYTEQAFDARLQGEVVLGVVIDPSGCPRNITVVTPLGLGLDEKAVEAIAMWRWLPAMKDGAPVPVAATIKISFRLM
jgi:TonB family protein